MNRRFSFWLLVIFLALAGVYVWQQQPAPAPTTDIHKIGEELGLVESDIQAIRLRDLVTQSELMLVRGTDGAWTSPGLAGTLDPAVADIISKTIVLIPFNETITIDKQTALTQYGFQPEGRFSIEVLLANGTGHIIAIGNPTPSLRLTYALIDQRPRLYLLLRDAIEYLIQQVAKPPTISQ